MPEEAAALRGALRATRRLRRIRPEIVSGQLAGASVALAVTGDGERNASAGIAALIATSPVPLTRLLVIGTAGALSPALQAGELVVAERVTAERGARELAADPSVVELAVHYARARRAVFVSSERIADSVAEKRRLLHALGGGSGGAAVVDLESMTYAAAAQAAAIPWIVLRAVSDRADEGLPALLNRCRNDGGAVNRSRVLRGVLADPRALPALLHLRRRVAHCGVLLARAAESLLRAPAEGVTRVSDLTPIREGLP